MGGAVRVLVGTTKGVFLLDSDAARQDWRVTGPLCDGWPINHVIGDPATGALWAAGAATGTARASSAPPMAGPPGRWQNWPTVRAMPGWPPIPKPPRIWA